MYRMTIFAHNEVVAKSRFWYFLRQLKKVKKATGEIVDVKLIQEKKRERRVKNYGVWLRFTSRTGTYNMYKEYRDLSVAEAVTACFRDMGATYRVRPHSVQIIRIEEVDAAKTRRPHIKQFHDSHLKFPHPVKYVRDSKAAPTFTTRRPTARVL